MRSNVARAIGVSALAGAGIVSAACGGGTTSALAPAAPVAIARPAAPTCERVHPGVGPKPLAITRAGGTVALAVEGTRTLAYVADEDDRAVHLVDVDGGELGAVAVAGDPSQLLLLPDGRLIVALRDRAELVVLEPTADLAGRPLVSRCVVETETEPVGLALTPDDGTLLVTHASGSLAVRDAKSPLFANDFRVSLPREPRAVVASDDGRTAFVTHAVGGRTSVVDLGLKRVVVHPLHPGEDLVHGINKEDPAASRQNACQGFALAKSVDPGRVLIPQVLVDTGDTTEQPSGYGSNETAQAELSDVAVLDGKTGEPLKASLAGQNGTLLDAVQSTEGDHARPDCLLPRAAAYDTGSRSLLVGCFGIDALVAYDASSASPALAEKQRWQVASGPSGVAVDPVWHRAVVWSQFERAVAVIPLDPLRADGTEAPANAKAARQIALAATLRLPARDVALGRILFHSVGDVRISRDGRACASCHPDGRDDGLTWATPNGPRRSIALAGRVDPAAPFSWSGSEATFEDHAAITFQRLKGAGGLKGFELAALAAYVQSLPTPARAHETDARVARGSEIFHSAAAGCAVCHAGSRTTDDLRHDVQSKTEADKSGQFNTPSLLFVGRGGPFFHDGRYASLSELLTDTDSKMGHTRQLSRDDLEALESYLRSL